MGVQSLIHSGIVDFSRSRTVVPSSPTGAAPTIEYLVIGGGGGGGTIGGNEQGGGGGAGGYRTNVAGDLSGSASPAEPTLFITLGVPYQIVVGAGGSGGAGTSFTPGIPGTRSALCQITSQGGGGGRSRFAAEYPQGGSGSGGTMHVRASGTGIVGEGFNGGTGPAANNILGAGGGGGAGAAGVGTTVNVGGAGGAGLYSTIEGGSPVPRGGGGGGGGQNGGGAGGVGGGANGSRQNVARASGTPNTGGGGGGGSNTGGGNGGSGIVIFSVSAGTGVTFSANVTAGAPATVNGREVYTVTATSTTSETVTFS